MTRKLEMTQFFSPDGRVVPATALLAPENVVAGIRTLDRDGYHGVIVGAGVRRIFSAPIRGAAAWLPFIPQKLSEFRTAAAPEGMERGQLLGVTQFAVGDRVTLRGTSKGKGFQGVVKRHGFRGHHATRGTKDAVRMPGSIGAGGVQHVRKGTKMAGRMGGGRTTVKNAEVVSIDLERSILFVKGAVPGARRGWVMVKGS